VADLKSPFPWFGGKATVASEVWRRLGDVPNYVEPFFGSGAVLLARPHAPKTETVNDLDGYVSNFWRAVKHDPDGVARWIDYPVIERDLEARHYWLITEGRKRLEAVRGEPEGYDAQVAGWWCWGLCSWIGAGWCAGDGPWTWDGSAWSSTAGRGVNRQLPHLGTAGRGVNRQLPHLGDAGRADYVRALAARLSRVRVASGDWSRVCGPSVTWGSHGLTGVFLDPPYSGEERQEGLYATDSGDVARECAAWAREAGKHPLMRIAFCGYAGEHDFPGWSRFAWKAKGGYGGQGDGRGRANAARETIWFSPACLNELPLFAEAARG